MDKYNYLGIGYIFDMVILFNMVQILIPHKMSIGLNIGIGKQLFNIAENFKHYNPLCMLVQKRLQEQIDLLNWQYKRDLSFLGFGVIPLELVVYYDKENIIITTKIKNHEKDIPLISNSSP